MQHSELLVLLYTPWTLRFGDVGVAFGAIRPPGHHAEQHHRAMGIYTSMMSAARGGLCTRRRGTRAEVIIDFDVHQRQWHQLSIFRTIRVAFSSFQYPFIPIPVMNQTQHTSQTFHLQPEPMDHGSFDRKLKPTGYPPSKNLSCTAGDDISRLRWHTLEGAR